MAPITRRRALQAAVGALAGLAGCNDGDDPTGASRSRDPDPDDVETDPDYVTLRASDYELGDRLAWFVGDPDARPTDGATVGRSGRETRGLIADRATADTLTIDESAVAETEVSDSPEAVREFVAETDFDRETLLLDPQLTYECSRLVLCYVSWTDGEYQTRYGRFLRDHDVACEADARDGHLTVARIPASLDPEAMESGGTGVSNGRCWSAPGERGRLTAGGDGSETGTHTDTGTPAGTGAPPGTASDASADGGER